MPGSAVFPSRLPDHEPDKSAFPRKHDRYGPKKGQSLTPRDGHHFFGPRRGDDARQPSPQCRGDDSHEPGHPGRGPKAMPLRQLRRRSSPRPATFRPPVPHSSSPRRWASDKIDAIRATTCPATPPSPAGLASRSATSLGPAAFCPSYGLRPMLRTKE